MYTWLIRYFLYVNFVLGAAEKTKCISTNYRVWHNSRYTRTNISNELPLEQPLNALNASLVVIKTAKMYTSLAIGS